MKPSQCDNYDQKKDFRIFVKTCTEYTPYFALKTMMYFVCAISV